ncbi:Dihydroflavonol 4-reductase [Heracleum sosnowskyi]|uniref:Dihydroflavonol 4-reductase n=1 Tax=Heracleum sosnowskyi TaxID=360622 RepID=A0AAD8JCS8_9APIA|nr:Dihydroflavonol 4-reductase [Heracleum sosnowskyi]
MEGKMPVCVTGASGYIGSWLVKRLLERGHHVRATVRDPGNKKKVNHLLGLPNASTNLSLWKADLTEEGSFDDAIQGCEGVFHVATPMELLLLKDNAGMDEIKSTTVNGILSIMKSCSKAKTLKRFIYTASVYTVALQPEPSLFDEYTEDNWSDVDFCFDRKMFGWMYAIAKTSAEKAGWKYAEENGIDMVTVHPALVVGHFITPCTSFSIDAATSLYTQDEAAMGSLKGLNGITAVHVDDVCNAHIYLFENPLAKGRYICSSQSFNISDIAHSLRLKYPSIDIPDKFGVLDKTFALPCSSKKLVDLGFKFAHEHKDAGDLCAETIESCKDKGLI